MTPRPPKSTIPLPSSSSSSAHPVSPFYHAATTLYCHTCGRVISSRHVAPQDRRRVAASKYCSARCKRAKPGRREKTVEGVFVAVLQLDSEWRSKFSLKTASSPESSSKSAGAGGGAEGNANANASDNDDDENEKGKQTTPTNQETEKVAGEAEVGDQQATEAQKRLDALISQKSKLSASQKGDKRVLVRCSEVQAIIFPETLEPKNAVTGSGSNSDSESDFNPGPEAKGVTASRDARGGQTSADSVNLGDDSVTGGEGNTSPSNPPTKQVQGMLKAHKKELIKQAARRLVVFGGGEGGPRLCEIVSNGKVVEPSYAKGDWGIRWRD